MWHTLTDLWSWLYAARVIAWLHIAGGVVGLLLGILSGGLLSLPFFGFSVAAGVLVLRRHRDGVEAALVVESFQFIAFQVSSFAYQFASGLQLYLYFTDARYGFALSLQSRFAFGSSGPVNALAVDLFSLVAIPARWKAMRERDRLESEARAMATAA